MFKKILTVILVVSILVLGSVAYAANTPSITAAITGLKIFFNGAQLKGDILTAKGVTYVPMDILSNNLGFKLSADANAKKFTITEKVSKDKLIQDNANLQTKINSLNPQITELNEKLRIYAGQKPQGDGKYMKSPVSISSEGVRVYSTNWNKQSPFKVKDKIYESEAVGVSFLGNNTNYACPFADIVLSNANGDLSEAIWYLSNDDSSPNSCNIRAIGTTLSGTRRVLERNEWTTDRIDNGFVKNVVDMKQLTKLEIYLFPSYSKFPNLTVGNNEISLYNATLEKSLESYMVVMGPYVK